MWWEKGSRARCNSTRVLGSELDKCVSQFEIIRKIQARFIVIVALHRHSIGGVAYLHLTKRENFPAKITV